MKFNYASLILVLSMLQSCATRDDSTKQENWNSHMRELAQIFSEILPYLSSENAFNKAIKSDALEEPIKNLGRMVSKVKIEFQQPHMDPSLSIVAAQFDHEIRQASSSLQNKLYPQALQQLSNLNRYCISCHTLLESNTDAFLPELSTNFENLSYLQRGDFYLATRRFSDAVYEYERGLLDPSWAQLNQREWTDHMQRLLSVVVRVRNSPAFTLEMVNRFFASNSYPSELRKEVMHWRRHIVEWQLETSQKNTLMKTPKARAQSLLDQAKIEGKINGRESVRILALRASGILHEELASNKKALRDPQLLYFAGIAASYLSDVEISAVPEVFFDRCILNRPNSELAAKCYAGLKALVQNSRFKSGLSPFVQDRVEYLEKLSIVKP